MSGFLDPVSQVPHKVEEEVAIGHADDLENHNHKLSIRHLNMFICASTMNNDYINLHLSM